MTADREPHCSGCQMQARPSAYNLNLLGILQGLLGRADTRLSSDVSVISQGNLVDQ